MRASLGSEGVRLTLAFVAEQNSLEAGTQLDVEVTLIGGTRAARVDALILRLIEADRHWRNAQGGRLEEREVEHLEDRRHLQAGWDPRVVEQTRIDLHHDLQESAQSVVEARLAIPADCKPTAVSRAHTLNVQADVKGQIDPTANLRVVVYG